MNDSKKQEDHRPEDERPEDHWVLVAKILRPHGLRGTFRLKPETRSPQDLVDCPIEKFYIRQNGKIVQELTKISAKIHKDLVQMKFKEISDRTGAEKFVNNELVIEESERWDLPEGEYYVDDLVGLTIRNNQNEDIGKVVSAQEGTAHDYLQIELSNFENQKALLPLIPEFVLKVNLEEKYVNLDIPEGLFE